MDERLAGIQERFDRADEHLAVLDDEVGTFTENIDRRPVGHFDREAGEYVFCIVGEPPPPRWGILVGEFVHHLRAALDEMVWQLVLLRGGTPTTGPRGNGFPILDEESKWEARQTRDKLKGLSTDDLAIVESVQPYQRFKGASEVMWFHELSRLESVNNADKHRFLQPSYVAAAPMQKVGEDGALFSIKPIKDCGEVDAMQFRYVQARPRDDRTEVARLPLPNAGPDPQMEMQTEVSLEVVLTDGDPKTGTPRLPWGLIRDIRAFVEDEVIKKLAPAFDG